MGAAVVRAYGLDEQTIGRVQARDRPSGTGPRSWRTSARPRCSRSSTVFYALAVSVVVVLGAGFGPEWGLTFGRVTAFLFLADVVPARVHRPARRSTARRRRRSPAGGRSWRSSTCRSRSWSPTPGRRAARRAPLSVARRGRASTPTARAGRCSAGSRSTSSAGAHVAIVGETGCGKTTFAKLAGAARRPGVGADRGRRGRSARRVAGVARQRSIRMVPQDGFLFDTTVRENVRARPGRARPTATSRPRSRSWAWAAGWRRSRRGWTRRSASEARRCPSASASSWRSRARRSPTRGC